MDYRRTALGDLVLRRRREPRLAGREVYEVKLGDEFLMSSLFTAGERALADLALAELDRAEIDVVVGGLGLGYTAAAVLEHEAVRTLIVVEALAEVIEWHRLGLVPVAAQLNVDPRCRLVCADFFERAGSPDPGFDVATPGRRYDAVLLDIDHSPSHVLHPRNSELYTVAGMRRLASHMQSDGVFALWSNYSPAAEFSSVLESVFTSARAERVEFANPYTQGVSASTIYLARGPRV